MQLHVQPMDFSVMSKVPKSTKVLPHLSGRSDMKGDGKKNGYTFAVERLNKTKSQRATLLYIS